MTVIAYARYSSTAQQDTSIDRQIERAEAYALDHGLTINERRIDAAKSAFRGKNKTNGELGKIIARVATGELGVGDTLIVEAIDRLSREDVMTALDGFTMILKAGVTVVTTTDGQAITQANYKRQWTEIIAVMAKMAEAHAGSERKSELGVKAWVDRRKAGTLTIMTPPWINGDKTLRPDRVETVKEVFALADAGRGCGWIAKEFNGRGMPSWGSEKTSQEWSSSYISRLLRNRAVLGECQPFTNDQAVGPVDPNYWPRIIDQTVFDDVQAKVGSRRFAGPGSGAKGKDFANLFRSLMVCEKCERSMVMLHSGKFSYLKCSGGRAGSCDHKRGYHYETLERAFVEAVTEIEIDMTNRSAEHALKSEVAKLTNDVVVLEGNIEFALNEAMRTKSEAWSNRVSQYEAELLEARERLTETERKARIAASPLDQSQRQIKALWKELYETTGDKRELRQRIHDKLIELTKFMAMSPSGSLWFALRDGSFYALVSSKPEGLRIKGKFPLDRYEWRCVHLDPSEAARSAA